MHFLKDQPGKVDPCSARGSRRGPRSRGRSDQERRPNGPELQGATGTVGTRAKPRAFRGSARSGVGDPGPSAARAVQGRYGPGPDVFGGDRGTRSPICSGIRVRIPEPDVFKGRGPSRPAAVLLKGDPGKDRRALESDDSWVASKGDCHPVRVTVIFVNYPG